MGSIAPAQHNAGRKGEQMFCRAWAELPRGWLIGEAAG